MTPSCSVFIATSLDGYIARTDGNLDWLDEANGSVPPGEDCGYAEFMRTVDTLVMGRNTYDKVLSFGDWPYGKVPVVVMSHRDLPLPTPPTVSVSQESPTDLVVRLGQEGKRHLYVDGGATIRGFLGEGLIDEFVITLIPVLLGSGISLFGPLESDVALEHLSTRVFEFGFVQHRYRLKG